MPAIKKPSSAGSKVLKKRKQVKVSLFLTSTAVLAGVVLTGVGTSFYFYNVKIPEVITQTSNNIEGSVHYGNVYVLNDDAKIGSKISDVASVQQIPDQYIVEGALTSSTDVSNLQLAKNMNKGTQLTDNLVYKENTQDVVVDSSRLLKISFLDLPGVQAGDYIDVRLKRYGDSVSSYEDYIVLSKKCVYSIDGTSVELMLTNSDIVTLNAAELECEGKNAPGKEEGTESELYVARYVDIKEQPKAGVTYSSIAANIDNRSNESEASEAAERLQRIVAGETEYTAPSSLNNEQGGETNGEEQ